MSSWLGRPDREREALKAARTEVMTVTGGQMQLRRDELGVTGNKEIQPLEGVQSEGKHNCKSGESPDSPSNMSRLRVFDRCNFLL